MLKGRPALTDRAGEHLAPHDFDEAKARLSRRLEREPRGNFPCSGSRVFSPAAVKFIRALGIDPIRASYRGPWQNGTAERLADHVATIADCEGHRVSEIWTIRANGVKLRNNVCLAHGWSSGT